MEKLVRDAISACEEWWDSPSRSPLVIFSPRQVGKSTLAKTFASKRAKGRVIEINFFEDLKKPDQISKIASVFEKTYNPKEILKNLSILIDYDIDTENDLLLLDEIQDCKAA